MEHGIVFLNSYLRIRDLARGTWPGCKRELAKTRVAGKYDRMLAQINEGS